MAFSGALTLTDLNDFITPSQACIKPVEEVVSKTLIREPGAPATEIQIDSSGGYYEVSTSGPRARTKLETAEISLNDCLACSGCITSAESVLITMQSHAEVYSFLEKNPSPPSPDHCLPVVSIAPQSLASLAASISPPSGPSISLQRVLNRVRAFCSQGLQIHHTFDTTFARHLALLEHSKEFRERRMATNDGDLRLPMLAGACPGWVCYVEKTHGEMIPFVSRTKSPQQIMGTLVKQWIGSKCYRRPDRIYHVTVMPCYDKKLEASRKDFYNEVYATRDVDCVLTTGELELMMRDKGWDLRNPVPGEDIELSPSSSSFWIPDLLQHPGSSSGSYLQHLIDELSSEISNPSLSSRRIRSADYEEYTLTNADTGEIVFKGAKCFGFRNLQNVVRKVGKEQGLSVGRAAAAGRMVGGRNKSSEGPSLRAIARRRAAGDTSPGTEVQKMASIERGYDYIEVMACPGGCVNGGGQIKPPSRHLIPLVDNEGYTRDWEMNGVRLDGPGNSMIPGTAPLRSGDDVMGASERWGDKEWVKKVEAAYWNVLPTPLSSPPPSVVYSSITTEDRSPMAVADNFAAKVLEEICGGQDAQRIPLLRTQYRAVESDVVGLAVKW